MTEYPKISILTPTLNSESVLEDCLKSISIQDYPKEKIEIIIADGGSVDKTLEIAQKYGAVIVENRLKTGEAGKKVALDHSTGEFCALIDSDNILPDEKWLKEMIEPLLNHSEAVGSEPWKYTWRKKDGFITRYCALIGMNDPLVHFLGNYDRMNLLTGKWTEVSRDEKDMGDYLLVNFDNRGIPTIGANGTVFRKSFLKDNVRGDYLFDIDVLAEYVQRNGSVSFIKVKNGIIHTFCESNIGKFAKKQRRRVKDFLYHRSVGDRKYDWEGSNSFGILKFILSCVLVFPLFFQAFRGYFKKKDFAWFFHPLACWITLWEYGWGYIFGFFKKEEITREGWGQ
ncbi:glycosyltransferase family 2 protein [Patescibacteria group bacterium]|nr:glycosyltransferase family 2 protein [Patescibacteria group bacterium]